MMEITKSRHFIILGLLFLLLILVLLVSCRSLSGGDPTPSPAAETATAVPAEPTATIAPDTPAPTNTVAAPTDEPTATAPVTVVAPTTTIEPTVAPTVVAGPTVATTPTVPTGPTSTPAPEPTRIQFEPGAYTALIPGSLAAGASHRYVLLASEAQLMAVLADSAAASTAIAVQGADGQVLQTLDQGLDGWSGHLPSTQDYFLTVLALGSQADYTLQVTVAFEEMPPPSERIVHESGAPTASVEGTIPPFTYHPYVLWAEAGQNMRIEITTGNGSTNFTLAGLSDGQPYKRIEFPETVIEMDSPISQDYEITVRSRFGDDYLLSVTLDPPPLPVVINPGSPPENACVAVHPGGVAPPVDIHEGPSQEFDIIARLGNWAEVVKISGPWLMILMGPGKFGWAMAGNADTAGPCEGLNAPLLITTVETPVFSSPEAAGEPLFSYAPQEVIDPLGRNADVSWWAVFIPGDGNIPPGWIAAENVTVVGDPADAPVFDN